MWFAAASCFSGNMQATSTFCTTYDPIVIFNILLNNITAQFHIWVIMGMITAATLTYKRRALYLQECGNIIMRQSIPDEKNELVMMSYPPAVDLSIPGNAQGWNSLRKLLQDFGFIYHVCTYIYIYIS